MLASSTAAQTDLFLSYDRRDQEAVVEIRRRLEFRGVRTFLDRENLVAGRPWTQALEEAPRSSRAVAVLLGRNNFGTWQKREMFFALDLQAQAERDGRPRRFHRAACAESGRGYAGSGVGWAFREWKVVGGDGRLIVVAAPAAISTNDLGCHPAYTRNRSLVESCLCAGSAARTGRFGGHKSRALRHSCESPRRPQRRIGRNIFPGH
jgi:hypothetical protein